MDDGGLNMKKCRSDMCHVTRIIKNGLSIASSQKNESCEVRTHASFETST